MPSYLRDRLVAEMGKTRCCIDIPLVVVADGGVLGSDSLVGVFVYGGILCGDWAMESD